MHATEDTKYAFMLLLSALSINVTTMQLILLESYEACKLENGYIRQRKKTPHNGGYKRT